MPKPMPPFLKWPPIIVAIIILAVFGLAMLQVILDMLGVIQLPVVVKH